LQADFESADDAKKIIAKSGFAPIIETKPPTLDELFRKTNTKPHLYFLPLTDAQVEEKKKKESSKEEKPDQPKEATESKESQQK